MPSSFSLHRDEEGAEGLKEQNWELPLQDGETLWTTAVTFKPRGRVGALDFPMCFAF